MFLSVLTFWHKTLKVLNMPRCCEPGSELNSDVVFCLVCPVFFKGGVLVVVLMAFFLPPPPPVIRNPVIRNPVSKILNPFDFLA